jgi:aquaporin Z
LAEFVGTFLLIFTVGFNVLCETPVWAGVSIACVLMVCIYAFGGISGANFNPAVSVALGLTGTLGGKDIGMDWHKVRVYVQVQLVAAALAGLCYYAMFGHGFSLAPAKGFGIAGAGLCELIYTCMLCFVVLNVAVAKSKTPNDYYGLAIGFVVVAGAYGAGPISGGCFNPAVALGVAFGSMENSSFWTFWGYAFFQAGGAALAAILFKYVRPWEFEGTGENDATNPGLTAKLLSEFLGTFMLVLTVGLNVLAESPAGAFSIAASLMCMIYALGDVSGAHFNPAVTVAISLYDTAKDIGLYILVQCLGGVVAAITYAYVYGGFTFPLGPGKGYTWSQVAIAEMMFTFVLCLIVLTTAVAKQTTDGTMNGLAIGSCITVGGFAIGSISGGALNPAVAVGIATAHILNGGLFFKAFMYSAFELVGAGAAAGVVIMTHKKTKAEEPPTP